MILKTTPKTALYSSFSNLLDVKHTLFVLYLSFQFSSILTNANAQVIISEASAKKGWPLKDGQDSDWLELSNSGIHPVVLEGCRINDKYDFDSAWKLSKLKLQPGQHILICASGQDKNNYIKNEANGFNVVWPGPPIFWPGNDITIHTSFKLSPSETIVLYDSAGNILDALPLHRDLTKGMSIGRSKGNITDWCFFDTPTPGKPNDQKCHDRIEPRVNTSKPSGWYDSPLEIEIDNPNPEQIVRYTTNGDYPKISDPIFPELGLKFEKSTVLSLRAWNIKENSIPSGVSDFTYIIDEFTAQIPTFSIITDDNHLWGWKTGIYIDGPNASEPFGANFWKPWSRFSRLEYFDAEGTLVLKEQIDLEIHGGHTRDRPQRSFRLDFKRAYTGNFDYPIFDDCPEIISFNNLNLRNGGNHYYRSRLQDAIFSKLARETHNLASNWCPALLYLNGKFWGLYGVRQKTDEHFIANEYLVDKKKVDLISPTAVLNGSDKDFLRGAKSLLETSPLSDSFLIAFEELFDVKNYIDYFVFETYIQNWDWLGLAGELNNVKTFRTAPDQPWRYLLYDTDGGFGRFDGKNRNFIDFARNPNFPSVHSNIFDKVLLNSAFRMQFINRYADLINTTFQPSNFNAEISRLAKMMGNSIPHHIKRWNSPATYSNWFNSVVDLANYNSNRVNQSRAHLKTSFGLPADHNCTIDVFPSNAGVVRVNTITPGPLPWSGVYFEECPIQLEAIAEKGWMFDSWESNQHIIAGNMNPNVRTTAAYLFTNDLFCARFRPCPNDFRATIMNTEGTLSVCLENNISADSIAWKLGATFLDSGLEWAPSAHGQYTAEVFFDGCSSVTPSFIAGKINIE